ncbi:MAG: biopolymer transporter ExbD [Myxococcaceae bacterium]|nr:biopolymer transporter ExbD [Myxococcaceae bacterium]
MQPQGRPSSDINVTPLVDVVLVLLIIFMVVTPLLEKDLEVRVPEQEQVELPSDVPPDQLVVSVAADGVFQLNSEALADGDYVPRLARAIAARAKGDRVVFFVAEGAASYARVVAALDGAKAAGAETLGMMTDAVRTVSPDGR